MGIGTGIGNGRLVRMKNRGEMTGTEMVVIKRFERQSACEAHCYQLIAAVWCAGSKNVYIASSYSLGPHGVNKGVLVIQERYDTVWHTNSCDLIYHPKEKAAK